MVQKIESLTSLRFIAAWSIVFYHMQSGILPIPSMPQFALGVSFFFVLSGFILSVVYTGMSYKDMPRFYLNRLARIWPVHVFILCLFVVLFEPATSGAVMLLNTFLVHAWIPQPGLVFSLNAVSWSISAELAFYLVFPALLIFRPTWRAVCVLALMVFSVLLGLHATGQPVTAPTSWAGSLEVFILQNPVVRILEFAIGVMAGDLFVRKGAWSKVSGTILELVVLALLVAFCTSNSFVTSWIRSVSPVFSVWYGQSGGLLIFAALIYIVASERGVVSRMLKIRPLVFLGEISFCTYMIHYSVLLYSQKSGWMDIASWQVVALWVVVSTFVASWVIWYFVERPARKLIAGLYDPVSSRWRSFFKVRIQAD